MSWIKKIFPSKVKTDKGERKHSFPEGVWDKCNNCNDILYSNDIIRNLFVCHKCNYHMMVSGRKRLEMFFDSEESPVEIAQDVISEDILNFKDSKKYKDRLSTAKKKTQETDALVVMSGKLFDMSVVAAAFDFSFIGGSMGYAVGEKFVQGINHAISYKQPFICFATSGGARMQEGLLSLFQMAKTSAALKKLASYKLPYISVLVNPTYGGVSASLAMLGDINISEPGAMIGFAGPRVIQQTVREVLPEGFQKSEFLLEHGFIDSIVDRRELRSYIYSILKDLSYY